MEIANTRQYNGHDISTIFHDVRSRKIVIFCHGYRGTSIGPSRFFVKASRILAKNGISSFRFDQYGSGNSEGDFMDSSFKDWEKTTQIITQDFLDQGYTVGLLGQSMGGATVICVGSELPAITSIVAWAPDAGVDLFYPPKNGFIEEGGQRVQSSYWQEAYDARIADRLSNVQAPMYIVQCSDDEYVSAENHEAIERNARPNHDVEMYNGYKHSAWTYEQAEGIINKSVQFLIRSLEA